MTMTFIRAVLGAVSLAACTTAIWMEGVTLNTCFYPFTKYAESILEQCDDCCYEADNADDRNFKVPFLGSDYDTVIFEANGVIAFDLCTAAYCWRLGCYAYDTQEFPFTDNSGSVRDIVVAMGYMMDHDTDDIYGVNLLAVLSEAEDMAPMVADVVSAGLADAAFDPGWAVLVTIIHTNTDEAKPGEEVNYQMVIISDGTKTYAIFKYGILTVPGPETSTYTSNCFYEARIGFYDHPNGIVQIYKGGEVSGGIGAPGTADSKLMMTETNCGVPGMVVFDVTDAVVVEPAAGAQCTGECGDDGCDTGVPTGNCTRCDTDVPTGNCTRCTAEAAAGKCYFAGFCFDVGTMVANLDCTLACTCEEGGKWDKCKPMKRDSDPRKMACLTCRAEPCTVEGVGTVVFGDSAGCGMAECLLSGDPKVCGDAALPCSAADVDAKKLVGKLPMLKGKPGWVNWCNAVDPPDAE